MSVQTTADDCRDKAREGVLDAIRGLSQIVVERCWGYDEYTEEYRYELSEVLQGLIVIRERLG